jgi:ankyrin repeat protein
MMEHLLNLGVDIDCVDDVQGPHNHGTPLHYAARFGKIERLRFLLEHGANPEIKNRRWRTPLEEAEKFCAKDIVKILKSQVYPSLLEPFLQIHSLQTALTPAQHRQVTSIKASSSLEYNQTLSGTSSPSMTTSAYIPSERVVPPTVDRVYYISYLLP